jgi:hypothetical protein
MSISCICNDLRLTNEVGSGRICGPSGDPQSALTRHPMSFRPIADTWILARSKVNRYGAYPSGFLGRARALLGVGAQDEVLHVCGGRVRDYPFSGFGINDETLDLDPDVAPDFLHDARDPFVDRAGG